MDWKNEWKKLLAIIAVFVGCFYLPVGFGRFNNAVAESLHLVKWYAREHVLLCLVPAFFIAGAISVFVSQASVMKYLGAKANKVLAYAVASVSGTILAVCSCTVIPLFSGMYSATCKTLLTPKRLFLNITTFRCTESNTVRGMFIGGFTKRLIVSSAVFAWNVV